MATRSEQKIHTSATVILTMTDNTGNSHNIGVGQNAVGTENFNVVPVMEGFGSIMPMEHVITEWSATVSVDKFFLRKSSLVKMGIAASGEGILNMKPINISFLDVDGTADGKGPLTVFTSCTLQTREFTVTQNAVVGERATWLALGVEGTSPIAPLPVSYEGQ